MVNLTQPTDLIIIGGGPAGLTAAIYASRASISTLVVAGDPPGGQLTLTTDVENYPGFPNGVQGPELITLMRTQAERFNTKFVDANVSQVSGDASAGFDVMSENGTVYRARSLIIATGASAKWLNLDNEQRLRGKGVSACATCDGFFFKNKVVAVVGAGDVAMEDSTFLTKFATKVYVLVRGTKESMRASKFMQNKAMTNHKIEFMFNTEVRDVLGADHVEGLKLFNNITNVQNEVSGVQGLFVAIGHQPNTNFLQGFIELDKVGYVVVTDNTKTSREGVFVAGDVADFKYRQAVSAAGLGCMAALNAEKFLASIEAH